MDSLDTNTIEISDLKRRYKKLMRLAEKFKRELHLEKEINKELAKRNSALKLEIDNERVKNKSIRNILQDIQLKLENHSKKLSYNIQDEQLFPILLSELNKHLESSKLHEDSNSSSSSTMLKSSNRSLLYISSNSLVRRSVESSWNELTESVNDSLLLNQKYDDSKAKILLNGSISEKREADHSDIVDTSNKVEVDLKSVQKLKKNPATDKIPLFEHFLVIGTSMEAAIDFASELHTYKNADDKKSSTSFIKRIGDILGSTSNNIQTYNYTAATSDKEAQGNWKDTFSTSSDSSDVETNFNLSKNASKPIDKSAPLTKSSFTKVSSGLATVSTIKLPSPSKIAFSLFNNVSALKPLDEIDSRGENFENSLSKTGIAINSLESTYHESFNDTNNYIPPSGSTRLSLSSNDPELDALDVDEIPDMASTSGDVEGDLSSGRVIFNSSSLSSKMKSIFTATTSVVPTNLSLDSFSSPTVISNAETNHQPNAKSSFSSIISHTLFNRGRSNSQSTVSAATANTYSFNNSLSRSSSNESSVTAGTAPIKNNIALNGLSNTSTFNSYNNTTNSSVSSVDESILSTDRQANVESFNFSNDKRFIQKPLSDEILSMDKKFQTALTCPKILYRFPSDVEPPPIEVSDFCLPLGGKIHRIASTSATLQVDSSGATCTLEGDINLQSRSDSRATDSIVVTESLDHTGVDCKSVNSENLKDVNEKMVNLKTKSIVLGDHAQSTVQEILYSHGQSHRTGGCFIFTLDDKSVSSERSIDNRKQTLNENMMDNDLNLGNERLYGICVIHSRLISAHNIQNHEKDIENELQSPRDYNADSDTSCQRINNLIDVKVDDFESLVCYCFITRVPLFDLFFKIIFDILSLERLNYMKDLTSMSEKDSEDDSAIGKLIISNKTTHNDLKSHEEKSSSVRVDVDTIIEDDRSQLLLNEIRNPVMADYLSSILTSDVEISNCVDRYLNLSLYGRHIYKYIPHIQLDSILSRLTKLKIPRISESIQFQVSEDIPVIKYERLVDFEVNKQIIRDAFNEMKESTSVNDIEYENNISDWALPVLLSYMPIELIIWTLGLLLCEAKLIIIGNEPGLVSCGVLGILTLLKPLEWVSPVIPMLPYKHIDFVESPVPIVAGLVLEYSSPSSQFSTASAEAIKLLHRCDDDKDGQITVVMDMAFREVCVSNKQLSQLSQLVLPGAEALSDHLREILSHSFQSQQPAKLASNGHTDSIYKWPHSIISHSKVRQFYASSASITTNQITELLSIKNKISSHILALIAMANSKKQKMELEKLREQQLFHRKQIAEVINNDESFFFSSDDENCDAEDEKDDFSDDYDSEHEISAKIRNSKAVSMTAIDFDQKLSVIKHDANSISDSKYKPQMKVDEKYSANHLTSINAGIKPVNINRVEAAISKEEININEKVYDDLSGSQIEVEDTFENYNSNKSAHESTDESMNTTASSDDYEYHREQLRNYYNLNNDPSSRIESDAEVGNSSMSVNLFALSDKTMSGVANRTSSTIYGSLMSLMNVSKNKESNDINSLDHLKESDDSNEIICLSHMKFDCDTDAFLKRFINTQLYCEYSDALKTNDS